MRKISGIVDKLNKNKITLVKIKCCIVLLQYTPHPNVICKKVCEPIPAGYQNNYMAIWKNKKKYADKDYF